MRGDALHGLAGEGHGASPAARAGQLRARLRQGPARPAHVALSPHPYLPSVSLDSVLANRVDLSAFYRTLWVQQANGSLETESCTSSPAFLGALWAHND